jgi:hypothetical protein
VWPRIWSSSGAHSAKGGLDRGCVLQDKHWCIVGLVEEKVVVHVYSAVGDEENVRAVVKKMAEKLSFPKKDRFESCGC